VVVPYEEQWPRLFNDVGRRLRRRAGSFNEQFALLFRDFVRSHPGQLASYAALKYRLAAKFSNSEQRYEYVKAKGPCIWETMQLADEWAGEVGWEPGPSDA
jgi:GrpB-like predicted nucleotidyltransferase (UPF0157 family)